MKQIPLDFSHPTIPGHIEAYLQAALDWTEYLPNGDPMAKVFTVEDFTLNAVDKARGLLLVFMRHPKIAYLIDKHKIMPECIGARLWTLHARHGIGFWDDTGESEDAAYMDMIATDMCANMEVRIQGGPEGCLYLEAKHHD
jgi:hypothetical protein